MISGFDKYATEYDRWFIDNPNVLESEVRLVAETLRDARRILSVGCGSGLFEAILADRYGILISDGIEPSPGMGEIARKRGLRVTQATAEEADYGHGEYDTILFNGSPGYITDLASTVERVYEALPEGGRLILIDIPKESSYGLLYNLAKSVGSWDHPLLRDAIPAIPYPIEFVNESNWRTTAEKRDLMTAAGFKDLQYLQTLTRHPLYSDHEAEDPTEGYDRGDYVAVIGVKRSAQE